MTWKAALRTSPVTYCIEYLDGRGLLHAVLDVCTGAGFFVASFSGAGRDGRADRDDRDDRGGTRDQAGPPHTVEVVLTLHGRGNANALTEQLVSTPGIVTVAYTNTDDEFS